MIGGLSREVLSAVEELRNLKTAHLHGLGNTLFYRYYFTITGLTPQRITGVKIVCTMADDALFPPYVTLGWLGPKASATNRNGILFKSVVFDSSSRTISYSLGVASASSELNLAITSSGRIATIERTE